MSVVIEKGSQFEKGKWFRSDKTVFISCPRCNGIGTLTGHDIEKDGSVSPSVECPFDGCDFHETVNLKDYY